MPGGGPSPSATLCPRAARSPHGSGGADGGGGAGHGADGSGGAGWVGAGLAALLAGCGEAPRPDLLVITVDTLRADRVGALHAPRIAALAARGTSFTHASTPRAKTTPALASLWTGLLPAEHGVRDLDTPLAPEADTFAEALARAGYGTAAIVGNFVCVDRRSGLGQGFEVYVEDLPSQSGIPERIGASITDGALAAYGLGPGSADGAAPREALFEAGRPSFLWLHYMDPHGPYTAPEPLRAAAEAQRGRSEPLDRAALGPRAWLADYNVPESARLPDGRIDVGYVRALYDAEVAYVDGEIGRLLAGLEGAGRLERSAVVLSADHGESLGENQYWFEHGRNAYEATCRVPLIVAWPAGLPGGPKPGVHHGDVSLVDLAPTLLGLLGLPALVPPEADRGLLPRGRDLSADWRQGTGGAPAVHGEKAEGYELAGAVLLASVRQGDWKLVRRSAFERPLGAAGARAPRSLGEELYELGSDPAEARDLLADGGAVEGEAAARLAGLRAALGPVWEASLEAQRAGVWLERRERARARMDPGDAELLRRLGYLR